ncbi:MAG: hypothetical protein OEO21_09170, partial [Candidatus Krumholzibacteria bacterium]|nr:hypothetical protein [Candidatus Krumholzibacteria bacterium]
MMSPEDHVRRAFAEELPRVLGARFEPRRGQVDMACDVAAALDADGVAVIEAGTGLGKSLAYLVPLVLHAERHGVRAVVSTHTRNLQRQLAESDVPAACAVARVSLDAAVLMGRSSYGCRRAVARALAHGEGDARAGFLRALLAHPSGDLEVVTDASLHLDARARAALAAPAREAACAGCAERPACFLFAARRRALEARVVIVNHALLLANVAALGTLLGPYDACVLDEAHHLEDAATSFHTLSFSPAAIRGADDGICAAEHEEHAAYARAKAAETSAAAVAEIDAAWEALLGGVRAAEAHARDAFVALSANARRLVGASGRRDGAERALVYAEGAPLLYGAQEAAAVAVAAMGRVAQAAGRIEAVARDCEALEAAGTPGIFRAVREAAVETADTLAFLTAGRGEDHVFYARLDE